MSQNLFWIPERKGKTLNTKGDNLKIILRKKFSLEHQDKVVTVEHIDYLTGLADAEISGATELIQAIRKHERVVLYLE